MELPSELWHKIMHELPPIDLIDLRRVCRYTARLSQDETFWYEQVIRTPRRTFQEDWFLFFAEMNHGAFLRTIYDLFNARSGSIVLMKKRSFGDCLI